MTFIASFDIGSSAVKAALVTRDGTLQRACTEGYGEAADRRLATEQDPLLWWQAFRSVLAAWWAEGVDPRSIDALICSGQMQSLIAVDAEARPVGPAWLHADARAGDEAAALRERFGAAAIHDVTRNPFNATSVLPKIEHFRCHEAEAFARTAKVLVGAKDYIGLQLTGRAVTDPTTAATTGLFDIEHGQWQGDWLASLGIEPVRLPAIVDARAVAGHVTAEAAAATGLAEGCPVLCGIGDAGATTLGAGVGQPGHCYAYVGTSAWVARVSGEWNPPGAPLFVLPFLGPERRILIGPVSSAGAVHRWALGLVDAAEGGSDEQRFAAFDAAVKGTASDPALLFLPYLSGERLPVLTAQASGTFAGISLATSRAQMARAALEGVSLSLRWALDVLDARTPSRLGVVGGATRSSAWMQILADVFDIELYIPAEADLLPCLGAAAFAAAALGWCEAPEDFVAQREHVVQVDASRFVPDPAGAALMRRKSQAMRRLQGAIASLPQWHD